MTDSVNYIRLFIELVVFTVLFWPLSIAAQLLLTLTCSIVVEIGFMVWRRRTLMVAVSRITETEVDAIVAPHKETLK